MFIGSAIAVFVIFGLVLGGLGITGNFANDLVDGTPCETLNQESCRYNKMYVCDGEAWNYFESCGANVCIAKDSKANCYECGSADLIFTPEQERTYTKYCTYPLVFG